VRPLLGEASPCKGFGEPAFAPTLRTRMTNTPADYRKKTPNSNWEVAPSRAPRQRIRKNGFNSNDEESCPYAGGRDDKTAKPPASWSGRWPTGRRRSQRIIINDFKGRLRPQMARTPASLAATGTLCCFRGVFQFFLRNSLVTSRRSRCGAVGFAVLWSSPVLPPPLDRSPQSVGN